MVLELFPKKRKTNEQRDIYSALYLIKLPSGCVCANSGHTNNDDAAIVIVIEKLRQLLVSIGDFIKCPIRPIGDVKSSRK